MAGILNWTNVGNRWRAIIKIIVNVLAMQVSQANNIKSLRENLLSVFTTEADRPTESIIFPTVEGGQEGIDGFKASLLTLMDTYLGQIAIELDLPETEIPVQDIIDRIIVEMLDDSETVLENTVSASGAADTNNTGDGTLFVTVKDNEDLDNEFIIPEEITLKCTSDNAIDNVTLGEEVFGISGEPLTSPFTHEDGVNIKRGTGAGSNVSPATSTDSNKVLNGTFETFTVADTPDNWTPSTPAQIGVNIFEEAAPSANVFHGDASLKLLDVAGSTTIELTQNIRDNIEGLLKYSMSVRVKSSGWTVGTLEIIIDGTSFGTLTPISISSSYPASYTEYQAFFNTPDTLPEDIEIQIKLTGADAAAEIFIDDLAIQEVVYQNGVGFAMSRGAVDFVLNDRFVVTVLNDEAGNIQSWFGRYKGRKLPSATSGAETISDTL